MLFGGEPHYFLMHGYLLMYCVYNTLCIALNWWIHLHPLENENSPKGQSHISLAVLPEARYWLFFLFCWGMESEKKREKNIRQGEKKEVQWILFLISFSGKHFFGGQKINVSLQNGILRACKLIYLLWNLICNMHYCWSLDLPWLEISAFVFVLPHCT